MLIWARQKVDEWHYSSKLFVLFIFLNFLDFLTTFWLVQQKGYDVEQNPFIRTLMQHTDSAWSILWLKVVGIFLIWYIIESMIKYNIYSRDRTVIPLVVLCTAFGLVVVGNFSHILILIG